MNLSQQQIEFTHNAAVLIHYIFAQGHTCTFGETYRTPEQAFLYAKQGKGIRNSLHIKRLAMDLNVFDAMGNYLTDSKDYEKFGVFWESLNPNNRWGGKFPKADGNHFERKAE